VSVTMGVDVAVLDAGAAAAGDHNEALAIRMQLAAIGQVTRDLTDDQVAELGRRIRMARPVRVAEQLHPFLAALLAAAEDGTATRKCCTLDSTDADCEAVHPGFTTPTAAFAAMAAEVEAEQADPAGYLAENLARIDRAGDQGAESGEGDEAACRKCGCTESRACPGGCAWATDAQQRAAGLEPMEGDVCTACLPPAGDAAAVAAAAEGREAETVWCEANTEGHAGGEPHFERPDCVHPHLTDARTRADMNAAALRRTAAGMTRQQAYLERDQDDDYNEGDEARDCVRVAVHTDGNGDRWQWCGTHRRHELIGSDDDAQLDAGADEDDQVAEVLAIAAAAPAVTVTDPAGLLELVEEYGNERAAAVTSGELAGAAEYDAYQARAAAVLARIAEALGLAGTTAANVPAPRIAGDAPPAG
jgi:hypothetical protein